ncbi:MAG: hypothetical protein RPU14_03885 [Candidatus Sedimenticola sp. (ex Thyasira tokunagai)]
MTRRNWKRIQPNSLNHAQELCLLHARERLNKSVDQVADLMGLANRWSLYKWMQNNRMPAALIRPFEAACGINYVTRYLAHSDHKLLIDIPTGRKATGKDIHSLQAGFSSAVGVLLDFYEGNAEVDQALAELTGLLEELAWHRNNVALFSQPELELEEVAQ